MPKVVRVNKTEFELDNGTVCPIPFELEEDMLTLMSSFSNKIYGKRSAENRKKKKQEQIQAAEVV